MGLPKGPEGQGLPEVRTSVPDTLGLLGREGRARGGGQGPALEAVGTLCRCSEVSAPRRALDTLEGQLTGSPGVQGCSVLLGANLKIPGSSGDGEHPDPCPDATLFITRSPGVAVSGCLEAPHVARLASRGQDCCAQESQQSRDRRSVGLSCPLVSKGGDLGTQVSFCGGPGGQPLSPFCREGMPPPSL